MGLAEYPRKAPMTGASGGGCSWCPRS